MNKAIKASIEVRQPKLLYECPDYLIEEIPHNYRIIIKCALKKKEEWRGLDRDYYTHPEHGLEWAKEMADKEIKRWFQGGVSSYRAFGVKVA